MDRDEKIDLLANHLTATHQDNVRLENAVERLINEIRSGNKETYEIRMDLSSFTAEARLLINDRISDMPVERLAEVLSREKIDKVRALLYARDKGIEPSPLNRDPTGSVALARPDENTASFAKDPWYSRAWHALLAQPLTFKISLLVALVLVALLYVMSLEIKANRRELRRQQTQEGKQ